MGSSNVTGGSHRGSQGPPKAVMHLAGLYVGMVVLLAFCTAFCTYIGFWTESRIHRICKATSNQQPRLSFHVRHYHYYGRQFRSSYIEVSIDNDNPIELSAINDNPTTRVTSTT